MDKIPFISNKDFEILEVQDKGAGIPSKACPICYVNFSAIIGLKNASRKLCQFCKRVVCKSCANRKITVNKKRVCKECYLSGLKDYYLMTMGKEINRKFSHEDSEIIKLNEELDILKVELETKKSNLNALKASLKDKKRLIKQSLIPVVEMAKDHKALHDETLKKFAKKQEKVDKIERLISDLKRESNKSNEANQRRQREFQKLREELSEEQQKGSNFLIKVQNKLKHDGSTEKDEEIVRSVQELKGLASDRLKENTELALEKDRLEDMIKRLDLEISTYGSRKSCRYSGNFSEISRVSKDKKDYLENILEISREVSEEDQQVEELRLKYEQLRMSRGSLGIECENANFGCALF